MPSVRPLPPQVEVLLHDIGASPRLVAHLRLVHDVAVTLQEQLSVRWPNFAYDNQAVVVGAATHDVGKAIYSDELSAPGTQHEDIGP